MARIGEANQGPWFGDATGAAFIIRRYFGWGLFVLGGDHAPRAVGRPIVAPPRALNG
jgi:hypothetical protein